MTSWRNGWHEMRRSCRIQPKLETHPSLNNFVPKLRSWQTTLALSFDPRSVQSTSCSASWMRFSPMRRCQTSILSCSTVILCLLPLLRCINCPNAGEFHWGILSQNHGLTFINTEAGAVAMARSGSSWNVGTGDGSLSRSSMPHPSPSQFPCFRNAEDVLWCRKMAGEDHDLDVFLEDKLSVFKNSHTQMSHQSLSVAF